METTITENINKVIQIKNDLNAILLENGLDGGRVFEDYPEKFRELFRVLQNQTQDIVDIYTGGNNIDTFVADPVITWFENKVTITCATQGASIYYMVKSKSGDYDKGYEPYNMQFMIKEDIYVEAYAVYNNVPSNRVSANIPFYKGQVPDNPTITRDGTTVTITCTGTYTSIWWSTVNGNYQEYTGPVENVSRTNDIWAYSTYNRFASDIVKDEAPEQPITPEIPSISCDKNHVVISTETTGATIWYMIQGTNEWVQYEGTITITESGYYRAKAVLNGIESYPSDYTFCEFLETPAAPVISCTNNTVTITAENGATIYYRIQGEEDWVNYTGPFVIDETTTYEAYCVKQGMESNVTTGECAYVEPTIGSVGTCSINNNNNLITITCTQTPDATIYYKLSTTQISDFNDHYTDLDYYDGIYNGPFYISENCYIYAYAVRPPYSADTWTYNYCTYVEPSEPTGDTLPPPTISCIDNIVSIATDVTGATIYFKRANDDQYSVYLGSINITQTTTFMAFIVKDNKNSTIAMVDCVYTEPSIVYPRVPIISCDNNLVTITCSTTGAVIYWRVKNSGNFTTYTTPIPISQTTVIEAYSMKNGVTSDVVTKTCQYVSLVISTYQDKYFSIKMLQDGYIGLFTNYDQFQGDSIYYSINDGEWTEIVPAYYFTNDVRKDGYSHSTKISASKNNVIRFKSTRQNWGGFYTIGEHPNLEHWYGSSIHFTANANFEVFGNIMSLLYSDDFEYEYSLDTGYFYQFRRLFEDNDYLISAKNLVLPAVTLSKGCYMEMFSGCRNLTTPMEQLPARKLYSYCYSDMFGGCFSLTKSPVLPAKEFADGCYHSMFYCCSELKRIDCYATVVYNSTDYNKSPLWNWVYGIDNNGKFYKAPEARYPVTSGYGWMIGKNGVPRGWNVYNANV